MSQPTSYAAGASPVSGPPPLHPTDPSGNIDQNIPVRILNESDEPFTIQYARQRYTLMPGEFTFVPYLAMCLYLGDPRSINVPTGRAHEQYRRNEYARLRTHWGVYENDDKWETIPKLTAYPIDSDTPFPTVLHDPEGTSLGDAPVEASQMKFMQGELEKMASKMRAMQAEMAARQASDAATAAAGFDPADLDINVTTSKSISPEEATGQSMVSASPERRVKAAKTMKQDVTVDGE